MNNRVTLCSTLLEALRIHRSVPFAGKVKQQKLMRRLLKLLAGDAAPKRGVHFIVRQRTGRQLQ